MHPTRSRKVHQQRCVRSRATNSDSYDFFNILTGPELLDQVENLLPDHRERLFPPTETLSMFLAQAAYPQSRTQKPGLGNHLIELSKPKRKPDWMTQEDYSRAPDTLKVRELQTGGKILVTTLLCAKKTPKPALKDLYQSCWHVELDLRNIKATLGLGILSCKTPVMAEKEIWIYLLAYNLIRLIMAQAAIHTNRLPRQLSFKHSLQLWLAWSRHGAAFGYDTEATILLVLIAQQKVGKRPGRVEPRALKRRPKPYPLLNQSRQLARQQIVEYGHPKNVK